MRALKIQPSEERWSASDGHETRLLRWGKATDPASEKVVIALHGYCEHAGFVDDIAKELGAIGIVTYSIDQRGFGRTLRRGHWGGTERMTQDVIELVKDVRTRHPNAEIIGLGLSMGAAFWLAANGFCQKGNSKIGVDRMVLLSPAVMRPKDATYAGYGFIRLINTIAPDLKIPVSLLFGRIKGFKPYTDVPANGTHANGNGTNGKKLFLTHPRMNSLVGLFELMNIASQAAATLKIQTLVAFGGKDGIMPRSLPARISGGLPKDCGHRVAVYPRSPHILTRGRGAGDITRDVMSWIMDPHAALPSGCHL